MKRSFVFFYCWSLTHPSCQEFTLAKLKAEVLNGYVVMLEGFGFAQKYDEAVGMAALILNYVMFQIYTLLLRSSKHSMYSCGKCVRHFCNTLE